MSTGEGSSSAEGEGCTMLEPGKLIRPQMIEQTAIDLVLTLYGLKVKAIKELNSYDDKNYLVKVDNTWENEHITELWPHGYVLKVLNSMDSQKKHIDGEHLALGLLDAAGFNCPMPVLNKQGNDKSLEKIFHKTEGEEKWEENNDADDRPHGLHIVRLLTFIPGKIFHEIPYSCNILVQAGRYIAKLENTLEELSHPALIHHQTMWSLASVPKLKDFAYALREEKNKELVFEVLKAFNEEVVPLYSKFSKGTIHGDYNEQNIIVKAKPGQDDVPEKEREYDIHGVIDFGDMLESYYVFEIAILIMYMMVESKIVDPILVGGHVLAGYLSERELNEHEFDALKMCVAGRFVQSLVMGEYSYMQDPGNEYLLVCNANGWPRLKQLWATPKQELYQNWRNIMESYK